MVDSVLGVLAAIIDGIRSIPAETVVALLVAFAAGTATIVIRYAVGIAAMAIRDRTESWRTDYVNRFKNKGLKGIATTYAIWLAGILLASVVAFIELRTLLPAFVLGAVFGTAITATVTLSIMGWQARGPSEPSLMKFVRIFYEPAYTAVAYVVVRKMTTIIEAASGVLQHPIAEISQRLVG